MTSRLRRNDHRFPVALLAVPLAVAGIGLTSCHSKPTPGPQAAAANPCGVLAPNQTSALPSNPGLNQTEVDCSAWQAFIALNWRADPAKNGSPDPKATWAQFGLPSDPSRSVWESYHEAAEVFGSTTALKDSWQAPRPAIKVLSRIAKTGSLDLSDIVQAGGGGHWLTNQRGDVTYYEVMMNEDEFDYITKQPGFDLTTAAGQLKCATQPGTPQSDGPPPAPPTAPRRGGLNFPAGTQNGWDDTDCVGKTHAYGQNVGAMEIKAAWTPLPADHSLDYRYKTAIADIRDPATGKIRQVTVGLVGMHIARKRFPRLPWVWATFEHIDNSPDEAAGGGFSPPALPANPNQRPSPGYTFFDAKCTSQKDPAYQCRHNVPPVPCGKGGVCMPYKAPMQITRINPVGEPANGVTAFVWSQLPAKSVFNYYRLVDVQWPQAMVPNPPPGPGLRVPLTMGNPTPKGRAGGPGQIVANTTAESFQQKSNSCMDCHVFASIATPTLLQATAPGGLRKVPKAGADGLPQYAADYSFIFLSETKK